MAVIGLKTFGKNAHVKAIVQNENAELIAVCDIVEEIANEYNGKIIVGKINVDDEMELAMQYKIEVIPTLLFFKDGKVVKKTTGVLEKKEIQKIIAEL